MTDTVIVSGGMIQKDFALDFLKKLQKENKDQKLQLVAADRGLDFSWRPAGARSCRRGF